MFRFGVSNLRRLKDVNPVDIRPITLLVGRNSSGKSTFLRTFPLLRQSLMTRTSSPILWYGDYVDFGSFFGAVFDNDVQRNIEFTFGLDEVYVGTRNAFYGGAYYSPRYQRSIGPFEITVMLSSDEESDYRKTKLSKFTIHNSGSNIKYEFSINGGDVVDSIVLNGECVTSLFGSVDITVQSGSICPEIYGQRKQKDQELDIFIRSDLFLIDPLVDLIRPYLDKRLKKAKLEELAVQTLLMSEYSDVELSRLIERISTTSYKKLLRDVSQKDSHNIRNDFYKIVTANQLIPVANAAFRHLRSMLSKVLYIGPARARSERYYRYQDLAVSEIDSDGKNFPMFLNSLSDTQVGNFSNWVNDRFGYGVQVSRSTGHISIELVSGKQSVNIVDTGYGVSQILPVLGQIWWASQLPNDRVASGRDGAAAMLLIEQPELHLHPAHQALLADAIAGELKSRRERRGEQGLNFIIETHSEALVNRLGELISDKKLEPNDVQILLFEPSPDEDRETRVRTAKFSDDGVLVNWPYGFFQPAPSYDF
jgi:predicted ATPase